MKRLMVAAAVTIALAGCKPTPNMTEAYQNCGGIEGVESFEMKDTHVRVQCKNGVVVCWWYFPKGGKCE